MLIQILISKEMKVLIFNKVSAIYTGTQIQIVNKGMSTWSIILITWSVWYCCLPLALEIIQIVSGERSKIQNFLFRNCCLLFCFKSFLTIRLLVSYVSSDRRKLNIIELFFTY